MYRTGYNAEMIRQGLIKQGYPLAMIDKVVSGQTINVKHEVHVAGKTFFALFLLIILTGGGWYMFNYTDLLNGIKGSDVLLDVSINTDNEYSVGQDIRYQVVLTSMGSTERFDAKIRYIISDENDNVKKSYSETLAVDTKASSTGKISLPSTVGVGRYYFKAVAEYEGKTAESIAEFYIVEEINTDNTYNEFPLEDDSTPIDTNGTTTNTNPPPKTSGDKTTYGEYLAVIKQQAGAKNDVVASKNCEKFSLDQKDICYSTVADASGKIIYCDKISKSDIKDSCLLSFVIRGNTQICDKIVDSYSKNYCKQANIVSQMQEAYLKNDTEKILDLSTQFEPDIYSQMPEPPDVNYVYNQPSKISLEELYFEEETT
jgi:hypothetical protein